MSSWIFLEELEVGDTFLVVDDDVFVLGARKLVAVFEKVVGVVPETFVFLHLHPCEVLSIAKAIIVGHW